MKIDIPSKQQMNKIVDEKMRRELTKLEVTNFRMRNNLADLEVRIKKLELSQKKGGTKR